MYRSIFIHFQDAFVVDSVVFCCSPPRPSLIGHFIVYTGLFFIRTCLFLRYVVCDFVADSIMLVEVRYSHLCQASVYYTQMSFFHM